MTTVRAQAHKRDVERLKTNVTMIRRLILILFFTLGTLLAAMAQNSIDRQVERYSAIGQSRFTSAVERDPRTRRVQKVVKVLELYDKGVKALIDAFKAESSNGDFTEKARQQGPHDDSYHKPSASEPCLYA